MSENTTKSPYIVISQIDSANPNNPHIKLHKCGDSVDNDILLTLEEARLLEQRLVIAIKMLITMECNCSSDNNL